MSASDLDALRSQASAIIAQSSTSGIAAAAEYNAVIKSFLESGGPQNDLIVKIGEAVFGTVIPHGINDKASQGPHEDEPIEGSVRLPFDYLETFMYDAFVAVGVPDEEARVSANVLIEVSKTS